MKEQNDKTILIILSELIFTFFPLIIASVIIIYKKDYPEVFKNSDWSYISIILFGQTIIKFFSGVVNNKNNKSWPVLLFILTMILGLGFTPAVTILILLEVSPIKSTWLIASQWIFLIFSITSFLTIGHIGQYLFENEYLTKHDKIN